MIEFETRGAVAILTLDNGRLNILTRAMHEQLMRAMLRFLRDDALKVAVLTCKPGTSFSAGDDLKTVDEPFGAEPDWEEFVMLMPRSKPMIAAVRGHCVGQGLIYLLMLTELRYCTPNASFGFPEIRHGMGGASTVTNLARQIPYAIAMHMVLTGEPLAAEAAKACHLVNDVVANEKLLEHAVTVAARIAEHPLSAIKAELWPVGREGQLGRAEAIAHFSTLWDIQRKP
jgi:enoyl-CoA hydratase/carnithine racemase